MAGFDNLTQFNSDEYAWKDLKAVVAGRPVAGIKELKWKTERTTNVVHASGVDPHTITRGNKMYSGTLSMLQSEIEALIEAAQQKYGANADLTDTVFDITVAYSVSPTTRIKVHQILAVHIESFEMGHKQDDGANEISLPFKAMKIKYNQ